MGWAQPIPARDLFGFSLGSFGEGHALATDLSDGLRNPAAAYVERPNTSRLTLSSLLTGPEQGVRGALVSYSRPAYKRITGTASVASLSVTGIGRTIDAPVVVADDIPYRLLVVSMGAAFHSEHHVVTGAAIRYRLGESDLERRSSIGADAGLIAERVFNRDVRLGLSTFFWAPGAGSTAGATYSVSADGAFATIGSEASARAGYSFAYVPERSSEHFAFLAARAPFGEVRAGAARSFGVAGTSTRLRLAATLHVARYLIAISREDGASGLPPTYLVGFGTVFGTP